MKKTLTILIMLVILAGGAWYLTKPSTKTNTNGATQNANSNTTVNTHRAVNTNSAVPATTNAIMNATTTSTTFTSTTLGYSFTYPAGYVVADVNDQGQQQIVRKTADDENFVTVSAEVGSSDDQAKSFADFAIERALSYCSASGPDRDVSCSGATEQTALTTPEGLTGLRLMLREATKTVLTNTTTTKSRGPVYALDAQSASKNKTKVMLVYFSASGTSTIDEANTALAKSIAESVAFAQ